MLTARRSRLSLVVHAIDDLGALCGAQPRQGRWVPNLTLPINCPRCLVKLTFARYAFVELPTGDGGLNTLHIRRIGPEGFSKKSVPGTKTLCGRDGGWDRELVGKTPAPGTRAFCPSCVGHLRHARTGGLPG